MQKTLPILLILSALAFFLSGCEATKEEAVEPVSEQVEDVNEQPAEVPYGGNIGAPRENAIKQKKTTTKIVNLARKIIAYTESHEYNLPIAESSQDLLNIFELELTPEDIIDEWGNQIIYRKGEDPKHYMLISMGADGKEDARLSESGYLTAAWHDIVFAGRLAKGYFLQGPFSIPDEFEKPVK